MDYIKTLGELALGSRLKRLSDFIMREVASVYDQCNIDFEPYFMPTLNYIHYRGSSSITEVSQQLGISQPAATQFISELVKRDYIKLDIDRTDSRRKSAKLSSKGKALIGRLKPIWSVIEEEVKKLDKNKKFMETLNEFESEMFGYDFGKKIMKKIQGHPAAEVKIVEYQDKYKKEIKRLNYEWLEKYFTVEPGDKISLSDPKREIIDKGGRIFFALVKGKVVGTASLLKVNDKKYELGKMAVNEHYQGQKVGQRLMDACLEKAKQMKLTEVFLYSNTTLAPAINLYIKNGFRVLPIINDPIPYKRSNIKMGLTLHS